MDPAWWASRAKLGPPGRPAPALARFLRGVMLPIIRVAHRATLTGVENLPASGPFLLVSNHSGALATAEIFSFASLYLDQVGEHRPLAGFAHPFMFHAFPVSLLLRYVGAIPSTYAAAESTLAAGIPLLVFPGGDHEAFRPIWQAYEVDFGGRVGFLRMARKAKIPIVPMGIRGSHFTAPVLWRSRLLSYLFMTRIAGMKRYPLTLLGVIGVALILRFVPWAWPYRALAAWGWLATGTLPCVAWIPWTIRMRIGELIAAEELFREGAGDEELPQALERVESAVRALVKR